MAVCHVTEGRLALGVDEGDEVLDPVGRSTLSRTCQTTTAAISMGLPSASLTFAVGVSLLRIRTETRRRMAKRFTQRKPVLRTVPR